MKPVLYVNVTKLGHIACWNRMPRTSLTLTAITATEKCTLLHRFISKLLDCDIMGSQCVLEEYVEDNITLQRLKLAAITAAEK